jgi:hypothetical protein
MCGVMPGSAYRGREGCVGEDGMSALGSFVDGSDGRARRPAKLQWVIKVGDPPAF